MGQPWDAPPPEPWLAPAPDRGIDFDEMAEDLAEHDDHHVHHHHEHHQHHDAHRPGVRHSAGAMDLRTQVRGQYGRGVSVGDVLSFLDFRVNELYAALLEPERHASRVPGSPVRMAGIDAVLNTDAAAFRTLTELGARLDRVEAKLDALLERLPER